MNILILYASLEGQTSKIAERMADILRQQHKEVFVRSAEAVPEGFTLEGYDAVIIGGSIHMGRYPKYLKPFVQTYLNQLNSIPSAFFTVCMAINSQHVKERSEARTYGDNFVKQTGWQPVMVETFAGAVKYTQYNFVTRFIMKMISKREGGSIDTAHDHEYTDWDVVARFTDEFLREITTLEKVI